MAKPITPDLVYDLVSVSSPSVSPDGSTVIFVKSQYDEKMKEFHSQVMVTGISNDNIRPFTQGNKDSSPRFSPDGKSVAFIRPDESSRKQIYLISTEGGEARQLTSVDGNIGEFSWSPDGSRIAFASDVDHDSPSENEQDSEHTVRVVNRIRYRFDTLGWRGNKHSHLFTVDTETCNVYQITDGDWDDHLPAWSPDGNKIAFISDRTKDRDITNRREAYVVSSSGGKPKRWSGGLISVLVAIWSPEGEKLLVLGTEDPEVILPWQSQVFVLEDKSVPLRVTDDSISPVAGFPPASAPDIQWTKDNKIVFLGDAQGETFLYETSIDGRQPRCIWGGNSQITNLSISETSSNAIVVSVTTDSPGDLHRVNLETGRGKRITSYNDNYFSAHSTGNMKKFSITRDGFEIQSRVVLPTEFNPSEKYPLIVDIHGGPQGAFYDAFNPLQQVLASAGYIVLAVNPRGSSGYGLKFSKAVLGDWGGEDYQDIMCSLKKMLDNPYVDRDNLGVTGYSYGGYMASWIAGHETIFKAFVVGAPVTNLSSMYGTSDIGVSFGEIEWGGKRMDILDRFLKMSPITYATEVEAPLLLLHGESDLRCPIGQSEEYFVALKRLGKNVEMVRFPNAYHTFLRTGHPNLRKEYMEQTITWFNRYLNN